MSIEEKRRRRQEFFDDVLDIQTMRKISDESDDLAVKKFLAEIIKEIEEYKKSYVTRKSD